MVDTCWLGVIIIEYLEEGMVAILGPSSIDSSKQA